MYPVNAGLYTLEETQAMTVDQLMIANELALKKNEQEQLNMAIAISKVFGKEK